MARKIRADAFEFFTKEILEKDYNNLKSFRKIAKKYNVSHETIRKYIHKYGIEYNHLVKHTCDDDFFSKENELSFYIAGYIAADGCIFIQKNTHAIHLASIDKDHLENIKYHLRTTAPLYNKPSRPIFYRKINKTYICQPTSLLTITSYKMIKDLKKFNLTTRKSLTYKFPKWLITHPLVHHFMRGYSDGDGGVWFDYTGRTKLKQVRFSMLGTKQFVKTFEKILRINCNIHKSNVRQVNNIYEIRYGGNPITSKIYDFLYQNASIFLQRKEKKFKFAKEAVLAKQI